MRWEVLMPSFLERNVAKSEKANSYPHPDGVLLGEITLDHLAHGLRLFGDMLLIWERENEIIYLYKILEIS